MVRSQQDRSPCARRSPDLSDITRRPNILGLADILAKPHLLKEVKRVNRGGCNYSLGDKEKENEFNQTEVNQ
jgi:hypothetical protein